MASTVPNLLKALALFVLGVAIVGAGTYIRRTDDLPGASLLGAVSLLASIVVGVKIARNRLSARTVRAAFAVGVLVALFEGFLVYRIAFAAPLHPEPRGVPSAVHSAPSPRWTQAVEQARQVVRAALSDQNLPGLSVAVGAGGTVAWAEGFGWADLKHRRPVTPDMRFRMGTGSTLLTAAGAGMLTELGKLKLASSIPTVSVDDDDPRFRQRCEQPVDAVSAAIADAAGQPFLTFMQRQVFQPLGMNNTGAESSTEENPEHVGEPEEDAPILSIIHDGLLTPLGGGRRYGPDTIATLYRPRFGTDPRRGVERMRPRNYSCFGGSMAFYSTPSDLVRFGLVNDGGGDGELAGGRVMSLLTLPDRGVVVAVMSNVTHAGTSESAQRVAAAFARSPDS
jgi:CubicO group peptidase (beta-lactamase class C family)